MNGIELKDVLITARQESSRMRHRYLGAEHLFIALLTIKGGLTAVLLEEQGYKPEYLIDSVRRKIGKGSRHRLWAGIPNTPRTDVILSIARDLTLDEGRSEIRERDLLIALIEESDSLPVRVMRALGVNLDVLTEAARSPEAGFATRPHAFVQVDFGEGFKNGSALTEEELFVLRQTFHAYSGIRVERGLTNGYTPTRTLVVTPLDEDNKAEAPTITRIGPSDVVLDEIQRYKAIVQGMAPAFAARLEEPPTTPGATDLVGIRYSLPKEAGATVYDLRSVVHDWGGDKLDTWFRDKFHKTLKTTWWTPAEPYRFEIWREYDWLLPPVLTLSYSDSMDSASAVALRHPIDREALHRIKAGQTVVIENFVVEQIDQEAGKIVLAVASATKPGGLYAIEVRGIDFSREVFYRSEVVETIGGRVLKTRHEQLQQATTALEPDFDLNAIQMPLGDGNVEKITNPLKTYRAALEMTIHGTKSTINGDLHLGNVLIGADDQPVIVDFSHTRGGHTLFDWAALEISLLNDLVMPIAGESWDDARLITRHVAALTASALFPDTRPEITDAMNALFSLREIVRECLRDKEDWKEYYAALAMNALGAINRKSLSLGQRRLMFLIAGLALHKMTPGMTIT